VTTLDSIGFGLALFWFRMTRSTRQIGRKQGIDAELEAQRMTRWGCDGQGGLRADVMNLLGETKTTAVCRALHAQRCGVLIKLRPTNEPGIFS